MSRRYYLFALAALLAIPVVWVLGVQLSNAINPEVAAGHPNYTRNFQRLMLAKQFLYLATLCGVGCLWLACGIFVLKAKALSYWWLPLTIFGPFGLAALTMLEDRAPDNGDRYRRFVERMAPLVRAAYEIAFFVLVWILAEQAVWSWRDLMIWRESISTGVPVAVIIDQQNASGGMWAFGEGLEALFLVALFYLFRPIGFNAAALIGKSLLSSRRGDAAMPRRD